MVVGTAADTADRTTAAAMGMAARASRSASAVTAAGNKAKPAAMSLVPPNMREARKTAGLTFAKVNLSADTAQLHLTVVRLPYKK